MPLCAALCGATTLPRRLHLVNRLLDKGKPPKVVLTACMRKLLVILNAALRSDELWGLGWRP